MNRLYQLTTVLFFALLTNAFGQKPVMELTFTAACDGQYVPTDSINIENLTQGSDTTLYAPDTVLVLDYIVGIQEHSSSILQAFTVMQNYPNPFSAETSIDVYLPEEDELRIRVYDLTGREVTCFEQTLGRGVHSFLFYAGAGKCYLLIVDGRQGTKSIKMVNMKEGKDNSCKLVYKGSTRYAVQQKSGSEMNEFVFSLGDQLRFTGYAQTSAGIDGSDVLTDSPASNTTYSFAILEGIPCPGIPSVLYEGQWYTTVQIGSQCLLKENLNVGIMIPGANEQSNNGVIEKYCYDDDEANCDVYGGLYQWNEMMQYGTTPGVRGICPDGWHLPIDDEWCILTQFIDPTVDCNMMGGTGMDAGTKMKSTSGWYGGGNGTNASGFTALPGGSHSNGFNHLTYSTTFWSSSESDMIAWYWRLNYNYAMIFHMFEFKSNGFSVRCVKDSSAP
jgi:uncharacterized protein (TIGR02145 family)